MAIIKVKSFEKFVLDKAAMDISDVNYSFVGLAGESGECMEWHKKVNLRGNLKLSNDDLLNELGDVLHYVSRIAQAYGWTLKDCMAANVQKLSERYANTDVKASLQTRLPER